MRIRWSAMLARRNWTPAAAGLLLLFASFQSVWAAPKLSGAYRFQVTWSVFPELVLAEGEARLSDHGDRYELTATARARLAAPPIDWRGAFAVSGVGPLGAGRPLLFKRRSRRPEAEKSVTVRWDKPGEAPQTETVVKPAGRLTERDPVNAEEVRNVVDPLSFMGAILRKVTESKGKSCDVAMTTWDGERLARISITTVESVVGARVDCSLGYQSIQGLRKDSPWRAEEESTRRILRFEREGLRWRPKYFKITGAFLGYDSTFTTTITPLED